MENDFNKELNITYVDETLPKPGMKHVLSHYLCSLLVYGGVWLFLTYNPFGKAYISQWTIDLFRNCYFAYILIAPIIFTVFRPRSLYSSHNVVICNYFRKLFSGIFGIDMSSFEKFKDSLKYAIPDYSEKQAMMLIFIKTFFGSLMFTFVHDDISLIIRRIPEYDNLLASLSIGWDTGFNHFCGILLRESDYIYHNLVLFLFALDLSCFCVGYVTEAAFLRNKIRSCELSFAGIFFCLLCYPPFNDVTGKFLGWGQSENAVAFNDSFCAATIILRIISLFFLTIYSLASVALGTKASNLTNRGTVSVFPYNIVRHPAYVSKLSFWFFTTIPFFFIPLAQIAEAPDKYFIRLILALLSFAAWVFIYYMRALTEERHLLKDPEYQRYTEKVKYKFIPGLF